MPPQIVSLPPRAGSMKFPEEDVDAVLSLLGQCSAGQAVRLTDEPDESDNTARRRAELMKEQIEARGDGVIAAGWKLRGHVLTEGDPKVEEKTSAKSGKTYKVTTFPRNFAAISLVAESAPDEPSPEEQAEQAADSDAPADGGETAPRRRRQS